MDKKWCSFIIPCYNIGKEISVMLDSILSQTFSDFRIVCVEDCSTDNTLEVLRKYEEEHLDKIVVIRNQMNFGAGKSRNIGFDYSVQNGTEFIWMVDGDDRLHDNDVLHKLHEFVQENPQYDMIQLGWVVGGVSKISSYQYPHGPWGCFIRSQAFFPFLDQNIQGCEDVYQHYMQYDNVPDEKIGVFKEICYVYVDAGLHRAPTTIPGHKTIRKVLRKYEFKKKHLVDYIKSKRRYDWMQL